MKIIRTAKFPLEPYSAKEEGKIDILCLDGALESCVNLFHMMDHVAHLWKALELNGVILFPVQRRAYLKHCFWSIHQHEDFYRNLTSPIHNVLIYNKTLDLYMSYHSEHLTEGEAFEKASAAWAMWDISIPSFEVRPYKPCAVHIYVPHGGTAYWESQKRLLQQYPQHITITVSQPEQTTDILNLDGVSNRVRLLRYEAPGQGLGALLHQFHTWIYVKTYVVRTVPDNILHIEYPSNAPSYEKVEQALSSGFPMYLFDILDDKCFLFNTNAFFVTCPDWRDYEACFFANLHAVDPDFYLTHYPDLARYYEQLKAQQTPFTKTQIAEHHYYTAGHGEKRLANPDHQFACLETRPAGTTALMNHLKSRLPKWVEMENEKRLAKEKKDSDSEQEKKDSETN